MIQDMLRRVAVLAVASTVLIGACTPTGQEADDGPIDVPQPPLELVTPAENTLVPVESVWSVDTDVAKTDGYQIQLRDRWFLATALSPTAKIVVGQSDDGTVLHSSETDVVKQWPALAVVEGQPHVATVEDSADPSTSASEVVLRDSAGQVVWRRSSKTLGQVPGESTLKLGGVDSGRIVVRVVPIKRTRFNDADLIVLNDATGKTSWRAEGEQFRSTHVENGVLLSAFRADGSDTKRADRVRAWDSRTGQQIFDAPIVNESAVVHLCARVLPSRSVLLCGVRSETAADGSEVWIGSVKVVTKSGEVVWREDGLDGFPVMETSTQTVAFVDADGALKAVKGETGRQRWTWTAKRTKAAWVSVDGGFGGWLVGNTGPKSLVLSVRTGDVELVDDTFGLNESQWSGQVYVDLRGGQIQGFTSPLGAPVGFLRGVDSDVVFIDKAQ